jgi:hypothetical protein
MVVPHRRCHYGSLVPFGRVLIWYFLTVEVTLVLSCHLGGCFIWYFLTLVIPSHIPFLSLIGMVFSH